MPQFELISVTPTVDTSAYADGDCIGSAEITLTNAISKFPPTLQTCVIESVVVSDLAKQSAALDLIFFNAEPSATTFTDNAALDIADGDIGKVCGAVNIAASDYEASNDSSVATLHGLNMRLFSTADAQDLFMIPVSRGTPTYVSASDLVVKILIRKKES